MTISRRSGKAWTNIGSFSLRQVLASNTELIRHYELLAAQFLLRQRRGAPHPAAPLVEQRR